MAGESLVEYKAFIDALIERVRTESYISGRLRRGQKVYDMPSRDQGEYNQLAEELTPEQRELVADLIQQERQAAIAEVLSFMTWKNYRLSKDGIELAFEPFGTENYYDLICRLAGDSWPDERESPTLDKEEP